MVDPEKTGTVWVNHYPMPDGKQMDGTTVTLTNITVPGSCPHDKTTLVHGFQECSDCGKVMR